MPNTPSLKNRRVYEALRRNGMPKGQAARISNAQKDMAIPPTGANALFNSMGIANRRRRCSCALTTKAAGPPGEKIAPGITRIRGNLCNVHGRYGPCDASGKPRKGAKPPKTDAQRAAERMQHQAERQAETTRQQAVNLTKVADDTGLGDDLANLDQFSAGKPIRPEDEETLIKQGVMERGTDGAARVTEQGRVLLNAAKRGDSQRARDALSRGHDQVSASASRATARQERTRAAAERTQGVVARRAAAQAKREAAAKKKPAKAGSSGGKQPTAHAAPPAKVAARRAGRSAAPSVGSSSGGGSAPAKPVAPKPKPAPKPPVAAKPTIAPALRDAATALSEGADVTDEQVQQLVTNGLVKLNRDGDPILTAAGLRATMKQSDSDKAMFANMGSSGGGGGGGGGKGGKPSGGQGGLYPKGPSGKRTPQATGAAGGGGAKPAAGGADAKPKGPSDAVIKRAHELAKQEQDLHSEITALRKQHEALQPSWGQKLQPKYRKANEAKQAELQKKMDDLKAKRADVLRDQEANTRELHAAQKDTALFRVFKSSDGTDRWLAITTTAYRDKDKEILSVKGIGKAVAIGDSSRQRGPLRYWHVPGLDIGDCDFQGQGGPGGRFLIESGTFRSKGCARLGQKMADKGYQMSPGFVHPAAQPIDGVFDDFVIIERSPVPANRASNYFTRLLTQEDRMLTQEKETELKGLLADQPDLLQELMARVDRTDKAAQAIGVTYKDAPDWAQALFTRFDALEATVKAFPPAAAPAEGSPEEEAAEPPEEEALEPDAADDGGGMDDQAFAQLIAQSVVQALSPLLDLEKKMQGHISAMVAPLQAQKDAAQVATAATDAQIAALDAKLKELTGDLPDSVLQRAGQPYRASEAPQTRLTTEGEAKLKEQIQQIPPGLSEAAEIGAYQLIFGNQ